MGPVVGNIKLQVSPAESNKKRIASAHTIEDFQMVNDEARKAGTSEAFSCPICFLYYTSTPPAT